LQLVAESKRPVENPREPPEFFTLDEKTARALEQVRRRIAGDLTFHERELQSPDPRQLSGAVHSRHRCVLELLDAHNTISRLTPQQLCELQIGNQMESAREIITLHVPGPAPPPQGYAGQSFLAQRGHRPAPRENRHTAQLNLQVQGLQYLARLRQQRTAKAE